jgi:3-methylcrotonyl-CoA carboxylase alpha subunit
LDGNELLVQLNDHEYYVNIYQDDEIMYLLHNGHRYQINLLDEEKDDQQSHMPGNKRLTSPMPSRVVALLAKVGENVMRGASLVVVEAMKMEHTIYAPSDGVVKEWYFKEGDLVDEGVELLAFEEKA